MASKQVVEVSKTRQYIENKCLEEMKDIFTDVSDEGVDVKIIINSRDTRGKTLYEIQFVYKVSFSQSSGMNEVKKEYDKINKVRMDAFDCLSRLESIGYETSNRTITTTTDNGHCSLSVRILMWK